MNQEKIHYSDIIALGFEQEESHDPIYFEQYGFDYVIITLKLTKRIYIDWAKETQLAEMVRIDSPKKGNIKNRLPIRNLEHLKELVNFFLDKKTTNITS